MCTAVSAHSAAPGWGTACDGRAMTQPIVDVGIPTHGRPRYLREAVESVFAQTYDRWQLTVSENGPGGDEIRAILAPFLADPRVRLVATGASVTPAQNATNAVQSGSAEYVAVLHDDDRWDPGFLERRVGFLEANPSCGFVFSHCNYIGAEGNAAIPFATGLREGIQPRAEFLRSLYRRSVIAMPTVLSRRVAYDAVGPRSASPCSSTTTDVAADRGPLRRRLPECARCQLPHPHRPTVARGTQPHGRAPAGAPGRSGQLAAA